MAIKTINQLDDAAIPIAKTDKILVSRDGINVTKTTVGALPLPITDNQLANSVNGVLGNTPSGDLILSDGSKIAKILYSNFTSLPTASSVPFSRYYVLDLNNTEWYSDGTQWRPANHISLASNGNPNTVTVGTTETVLAQYTFKPSQIHKNGKVIIDAFLSYPNSANNKTFYLRLGGTGVNGAILWQQGQTTTTKYIFRAGFQNRNSMSSQVQTNIDYGSGYGATTSAIVTSSVDMTLEQTVYLTAVCANSAETITLQSYSISQS